MGELAMPAKFYIDDQNRILFTVWEGEATDSDLIDTLKRYKMEIIGSNEYIDYDELVNLREMTGTKLSLNGLKKIAQAASSTDNETIKTKLALIVSTDIAFSLARMYEAYRTFTHKSNKEIRVFKMENDALEWLHTTPMEE